MNLQLKGVQGVINALAQLDNEVSREVDGELESSCNTIAKKAKSIAPSNFSQLKGKIGFEKIAFMQYTIFSNAPHAAFVEFGTRGKTVVPPELEEQARIAQKTSKGNWMQFVNSIYEWGTKKKVIKKGDKNHAVNIARKIYKFGIAPQPYLWPSFVAERSKLVRRITDIVKKKR
jgi:hypothetical protein